MCGRFTLVKSLQEIIKRFNIQVQELVGLYQKNGHISPGQDVLVVYNNGRQNILESYRWGLVPRWAKESKIGYKMINARVETVAAKPSFKDSFINSRCLVIADGYYEWLSQGNKKKQYYFHLDTPQLFGFAGIREFWPGPEGILKTCSILTAAANEKISAIHDRMPLIIGPELERDWLNSQLKNKDELFQLLKNNSNDRLKYHEVAATANSSANNKRGNIRQISFWTDN